MGKLLKFPKPHLIKTHAQDRVDELFEKLLEAVTEYGECEDQEFQERLDQCFFRLHEASDWWERWKED